MKRPRSKTPGPFSDNARMSPATYLDLRPATAAERPAIEAACRETFERHVAALPHSFHPEVFDRFYGAYIAACFKDKTGKSSEATGVIEAAFVDGTFAGYVILAESHHTGGGLEVFDIHVFAPFRGQGVGRALVEWCKTRATELEKHHLHASVWATGDARASFFEAAGLTKVYELWRFGPDVTPPPIAPAPRPGWIVRTCYNPLVQWLVIVGLLLLALWL